MSIPAQGEHGQTKIPADKAAKLLEEFFRAESLEDYRMSAPLPTKRRLTQRDLESDSF